VHASDLKRERDAQLELVSSLKRAKLSMREMLLLSLELQSLAKHKADKTTECWGQVEKMHQEMDQLTNVKDGQQKELEQLCKTVEQRDAEIQHLKQHVATL
jgi:cell division protein FtsB